MRSMVEGHERRFLPLRHAILTVPLHHPPGGPPPPLGEDRRTKKPASDGDAGF
jgi:hypothetical protein